MRKKLFCEICPLTYKISVLKNILLRHIKNLIGKEKLSGEKSYEKLPCSVFRHSSPIRRTLGNVDMTLQENKAKNLSLAAPKVNGILIKPGETFSFWSLVGKCRAKDGYKKGLTISNSGVSSGVGGGMCQLTNLIHWMVLHSPLDITEHHHHDEFDLFPDCERRVPFGTGTSIAYNYLDYRFKNNTDNTYQLMVYVTDKELCGELLSLNEQDLKYEIRTLNEGFIKENGVVLRVGSVWRKCINKTSGKVIFDKCIRENRARVMYDTDF